MTIEAGKQSPISPMELGLRQRLLGTVFGLPENKIKCIRETNPNLLNQKEIEIATKNLEAFGFKQIEEAVNFCPRILTKTKKELEVDIDRFKNLGIDNPQLAIINNPWLAFMDDNKFTTLMTEFENAGIPSGLNMVNNNSQATNLLPAEIFSAIEKLKLRQFKSPEKMIEISCQIAQLPSDIIGKTIVSFQNFGFGEHTINFLSDNPILLNAGILRFQTIIGIYSSTEKSRLIKYFMNPDHSQIDFSNIKKAQDKLATCYPSSSPLLSSYDPNRMSSTRIAYALNIPQFRKIVV